MVLKHVNHLQYISYRCCDATDSKLMGEGISIELHDITWEVFALKMVLVKHIMKKICRDKNTL